MTSTVSDDGRTLVPRELRERLQITAGTMLEWREESGELRVAKVEANGEGSFVAGLRRLGVVPAVPRDKKPIQLEQ